MPGLKLSMVVAATLLLSASAASMRAAAKEDALVNKVAAPLAAAVSNASDLVTASTCGGNCPGGRCNSCPCGTSRNTQDITTWCAKFSGWNQAACRCIMSHESGGNANAMNGNTNGSIDVGLWQINSMNWASCSGGSAPCDPSTNLGCAIKVWQWGGNSFRLWSTCSVCGVC